MVDGKHVSDPSEPAKMQLLNVTQELHQSLDEKEQAVDMGVLHIYMAFDKVPHKILMSELRHQIEAIPIGGYSLSWRVVVNMVSLQIGH